jgi:3-methyladenine DNA glycosylase AlkD
MTADEIITLLKTQSSPTNVAGMARFGINPAGTLGISIPFLRALAKKIGKDQALSLELWRTGIHEARILAAFIGVPAEVNEEQMEAWVLDFDSWDVCDQVCGSLFDRTPYAYSKAVEWARRPEEFVRRAGFVLMASLAVHDKQKNFEGFADFLPLIYEGADDDRNFVKKAVNWALRQIGKRDDKLRPLAIGVARELAGPERSASSRWIGKDALRELTGIAGMKRP